MTTTAVLLLMLVSVAVSLFLRHERKAARQSLLQLARTADSLQRSTALELRSLLSKIDEEPKTPPESEGRASRSQHSGLIKISEAVVYTKHWIVTYYDPEANVAIPTYGPLEFLAIDFEAGQEERPVSGRLKESGSIDNIVRFENFFRPRSGSPHG